MRFARSRPTVVTCMADGSSLWRHTTTTTLGTRCRSAGAVHPINFARFAQSGPDPPHDAAPHLAHRGARADDPSAISDADDAWDPDAPRAGFDAYLHEMRDVAESDEVGEDGPAHTGEPCCQPLIDHFWLPGCFPADLHFERWPSDGFKNLSRRLIGRSSGRELVECLEHRFGGVARRGNG